jgi:hypothetical protein
MGMSQDEKSQLGLYQKMMENFVNETEKRLKKIEEYIEYQKDNDAKVCPESEEATRDNLELSKEVERLFMIAIQCDEYTRKDATNPISYIKDYLDLLGGSLRLKRILDGKLNRGDCKNAD